MNRAKHQFNKVAVEYDFVNTLLNDYSFFMSNLPEQRGRALDVGCGSGILVHELSSHFEEVIGIDNTSKSWLEHLASDKYLSEKQYYDLYGKLLPNCRFQKMGWAMGVVWEK